MIPSGFAETGETELQQQLVDTAREHGVRFVGPNIYGVYYTAGNMSAAFTTPVRRQGPGRAGVAERRHRHGDPRLRPLDQDGRVRDRRARQQGRHRRGRPAHVLRARRRHELRRAAHGGPQGRPLVRRGRPARVEEEADRRAQGGRDARGHEGGGVAHGGAGRRRQGLRRHPARGRRGPGERAPGAAPVRPRPADPADADGRERRHHHGRRRLRRAALRRLLQHRPAA